MSYKLYADDRRVEEIFSANELREKAGHAKVNPKEKKICNCPNCGAPISSYICEYCGTEFEKPKKKLPDEEMRESLALQNYSLRDQTHNASMLTNVYPYRPNRAYSDRQRWKY